jgi:hypothetical protein
MRVGNRIVSRYQTQSGSSAIYATPTNRFRNAATLMPMGTNNGGFSMPMGISEGANFQNANGSAEEIGGKQENPTRGLYGIVITTNVILSDKMLYNVLADAMRNENLVITPNFSPQVVKKGKALGSKKYTYVVQIRIGLMASNFVLENVSQRQSEYTFINNFGKKSGIPYKAEFLSGYLHSLKGGDGTPIFMKPIGGGGSGRIGGKFKNASGVLPTPPDSNNPTCPMGYAQKTYTYLNGKTRTICVPLPRRFVYSD